MQGCRCAVGPAMRRASELFAKTLKEAGLSNSRLADKQDHLTLALARLIPAAQDKAQFVLPTDKRRQPPPRGGSNPPPHSARPDHPIQLHRLRDALEQRGPLILDQEQTGDEVMRRGGDEHGIRRGGVLHPRCHDWHVAVHIGSFAAALADDDGAAVYPDACGELGTLPATRPAVQRRDRIEDREPGEHGVRGGVIVGPRITEIG